MGLFVSGQFTAPMLAAILMIVGYSINDTIVAFDRIREELELNPGTDLRSIINLAINGCSLAHCSRVSQLYSPPHHFTSLARE